MTDKIVTDPRKAEPEVILSTSDEAASIQAVTGWVSRAGRFWGDDERMARYDGCTHVVCDCGAAMSKGYTKCDVCRRVAELARYEAKPRAAWDGVEPIYSDAADRYFFCNDELADFIDEHEGDIASLRFMLCEPNYARQVEPDHWCDELPEEGDIPDELNEALRALNDVVRKLAPLSWSPGKAAATVESVRAATKTEATGVQP